MPLLDMHSTMHIGARPCWRCWEPAGSREYTKISFSLLSRFLQPGVLVLPSVFLWVCAFSWVAVGEQSSPCWHPEPPSLSSPSPQQLTPADNLGKLPLPLRSQDGERS